MTKADTNAFCLGCMTDQDGMQPCPSCGFTVENERSPLPLPYRSILNDRFFVGRVLGRPGGFGITYLAWDMTLETRIALKEFLPGSVVTREHGGTSVIPNSPEDRDVLDKGLIEFLAEARTLAKFVHPNIVRVRDFFTANNTGYLVMDYYDGISLRDHLVTRGGKLEVDEALRIVVPILEGLEAVHAQGFLHRDIKPDNIYLTEQQIPTLLDFGAARMAIGEKSQTLSVILTPGYAPYEQYHKKVRQGPWTDMYAMGAPLFYLLTGARAPDALSRVVDDELVAPRTLDQRIPQKISDAVLWPLNQTPQNRPQSAGQFLAALRDNPSRAGRVGPMWPSHTLACGRRRLRRVQLRPLSSARSNGAAYAPRSWRLPRRSSLRLVQ
jgi:serine/threonine protein kinase